MSIYSCIERPPIDSFWKRLFEKQQAFLELVTEVLLWSDVSRIPMKFSVRDKNIWKAVRFQLDIHSSCSKPAKTVPRLAKNVVETEQWKKKRFWNEKKQFHSIKIYTRGWRQSVIPITVNMAGLWRPFWKASQQRCYLLSCEISILWINTRLSPVKIEISIENSSSPSRHIYN